MRDETGMDTFAHCQHDDVKWFRDGLDDVLICKDCDAELDRQTAEEGSATP